MAVFEGTTAVLHGNPRLNFAKENNVHACSHDRCSQSTWSVLDTWCLCALHAPCCLVQGPHGLAFLTSV